MCWQGLGDQEHHKTCQTDQCEDAGQDHQALRLALSFSLGRRLGKARRPSPTTSCSWPVGELLDAASASLHNRITCLNCRNITYTLFTKNAKTCLAPSRKLIQERVVAMTPPHCHALNHSLILQLCTGLTLMSTRLIPVLTGSTGTASDAACDATCLFAAWLLECLMQLAARQARYGILQFRRALQVPS